MSFEENVLISNKICQVFGISQLYTIPRTIFEIEKQTGGKKKLVRTKLNDKKDEMDNIFF